MKNVCIIGGGASGMTAAIAAARGGAKVTILEHKNQVGKKILSTGNGRCNLTNEQMGVAYYRSDDPEILSHVLTCFDVPDTLAFMQSLGVMTKNKGTYIYPRTEQAQTVLDAFMMELKRLSVHIHTDTHITAIDRTKRGFVITAEDGSTFRGDSVILATGGRAASVLGSDGSGYTLAKSLGHTLSPVVPALAALKAKGNYFKKITGVRAEAKVSLCVEHTIVASDTGELQLTNYGISGIPVFQVCRYAAKALRSGQQVEALLDFLPGMTVSDSLMFFQNRIERFETNTATEYLSGVLHKKLVPVLLQRAGISPEIPVRNLSPSQMERLNETIHGFCVEITETNPFEQAQVCAGGVRTSEINADTLESLYCPGLYLTGELLDVDGICGGYNLQWAFATGYLAGTHAANPQ